MSSLTPGTLSSGAKPVPVLGGKAFNFIGVELFEPLVSAANAKRDADGEQYFADLRDAALIWLTLLEARHSYGLLIRVRAEESALRRGQHQRNPAWPPEVSASRPPRKGQEGIHHSGALNDWGLQSWNCNQ